MDTNNNEDDCYIKNGDEDDKPREAASMNSLVIEEVTITVKNMDTTEGENGNVSMIVKLNQNFLVKFLSIQSFSIIVGQMAKVLWAMVTSDSLWHLGSLRQDRLVMVIEIPWKSISIQASEEI